MAYTLSNRPQALNRNLPGAGELYQLESDFVLRHTDDSGDPLEIRIPAGFICDGSSIPRALWTLIGLHKDGKNREPSLVHDWLYMHQGRIPERKYSRQEADRLYYDMLIAYGVPNKSAWRSYKGVRWFGKKHWKSKDKELLQRNAQIPSLQSLLD